jgi:predicted phosphoribosyltransferase
MSSSGYADRRSAGALLARAIVRRHLPPPVLVLGLPRGGVPVAYEIARALHAPLDIMAVRKVGMPGQPELAIGAIASGGIAVRDPAHVFWSPRFDEQFEAVAQRERLELARRERVYRGTAPPPDLKGRTVVLVDDGLATGSTMLAAVRAAKQAGAARVIATAPIGSDEAAQLLRHEADDVLILTIPPQLRAIGEWYGNFDAVEDAEVCGLLERAKASASPDPARPGSR